MRVNHDLDVDRRLSVDVALLLPVWQSDYPYAASDVVLYDNVLYRAKTPTEKFAFDEADWDAIGGGGSSLSLRTLEQGTTSYIDVTPDINGDIHFYAGAGVEVFTESINPNYITIKAKILENDGSVEVVESAGAVYLRVDPSKFVAAPGGTVNHDEVYWGDGTWARNWWLRTPDRTAPEKTNAVVNFMSPRRQQAVTVVDSTFGSLFELNTPDPPGQVWHRYIRHDETTFPDTSVFVNNAWDLNNRGFAFSSVPLSTNGAKWIDFYLDHDNAKAYVVWG